MSELGHVADARHRRLTNQELVVRIDNQAVAVRHAGGGLWSLYESPLYKSQRDSGEASCVVERVRMDELAQKIGENWFIFESAGEDPSVIAAKAVGECWKMDMLNR